MQLVESALEELSTDHPKEFHTIRLSGFIHTDDKLALKEIWRQLGKEMDIEDGSTARVRNPGSVISVAGTIPSPL